MLYKKAGLLVLLIAVSCCIEAQTADEILSKYISFTGGEQQWKRVHSIVTEGTYNYGGMVFPFTAYSKTPDKYKFVVPFKGKYFAQAYDGTQGWKIDAFKGETTKTILTGKPARALANEADPELESPFINYAAKGHQATAEGIDTVQGVACYKVRFIRKEGDTAMYYFNTGNGELMEKQAAAKNAELENSLLTTYYTDYRVVDGIKLPFVATSKVNGQTILTITITIVRLNAELPDKEFAP